MSPWETALLAAYASLIVEITCFPIPSEASVVQLMGRSEDTGETALAAARSADVSSKVLRFLVPTALCVALFALPLVVACWPESRRLLAPWTAAQLQWPGVAVVLLGRATTFCSVLQLRAAKRRGELPAGLFTFSRNPGLVGMFVMYIGLCLAVGGPWLWLGAPLYFWNMHGRVRLEESDLQARHADTWSRYAVDVPRYLALPGLR